MLQQSMRLIDLAPQEWFSNKETSSIWVSCYRIFRVSPDILETSKIINLLDVVVLPLWGTIHYIDSSQAKMVFITEEKCQIDTSLMCEKDTLEGAYVILISPYIIDGRERQEIEVRQSLQETIALLIAMNGRNAAFEFIFDNIIPMTGESTTAISQVSVNPLAFAAPDFSPERLSDIQNVAKAIDYLVPEEKNRIKLSLRWFESAMRKDGVDSFLSFWIALETLVMDNTDIRPINQSLANAYGVSIQEASKQFGVGRVFGLRSQIVHHGHIAPIHQNLERYMEALYSDLLLAELNLPSEHKAQLVLNDPEFDLISYVSV
jgi:Apea-like HEPN